MTVQPPSNSRYFLVVLSGAGMQTNGMVQYLEASGSTTTPTSNDHLIYLSPIGVDCLYHMKIETMILYDPDDVNHLADSYNVPNGYEYNKLSNKLFNEIIIDYNYPVYVGDSPMNNNAGSTSSGTVTQSGKYVCGDYTNTPDDTPMSKEIVWGGSENARYSSTTISLAQAHEILGWFVTGVPISISLQPTMISYVSSCDGSVTPDYNTWVRISDKNGNLIYNGFGEYPILIDTLTCQPPCDMYIMCADENCYMAGTISCNFICITYGFLYNRHALTDSRSITNTGWRVPTVADYQELLLHIDPLSWEFGSTNAGGYLKESGITHWESPNSGAINSYNFNARGSGNRNSSGIYENFREYEGFTCLSSRTLVLTDSSNDATLYSTSDQIGSALRLIKNNPTAEELALPDGNSGIPYVGNDGKIYRTVKIGSQVWIADNLVETKYNNDDWIAGYDGGTYTPISTATWAGLSTGALSAYDDNISNALCEEPTPITTTTTTFTPTTTTTTFTPITTTTTTFTPTTTTTTTITCDLVFLCVNSPIVTYWTMTECDGTVWYMFDADKANWESYHGSFIQGNIYQDQDTGPSWLLIWDNNEVSVPTGQLLDDVESLTTSANICTTTTTTICSKPDVYMPGNSVLFSCSDFWGVGYELNLNDYLNDLDNLEAAIANYCSDEKTYSRNSSGSQFYLTANKNIEIGDPVYLYNFADNCEKYTTSIVWMNQQDISPCGHSNQLFVEAINGVITDMITIST